ncbi:MAG: hypothetical protein FH751_03850 [Firmicutes bacterium]|nr:hypothetical protein [Bacillota bacterium]
MNKKKIILKSVGFLTAGVIVSGAFLINFDTYSWFSDEMTSQVRVMSATTEDLIKILDKSMEEENGKWVNPKEIKIKGTDKIATNATFYFSLDGDIKDYILHINPAKLRFKGGIYTADIKPNINLIQFINLLIDGPKKINGTLKIKYLNEFIDEPREVSFTREYLIKQFRKEFDKNDSKEVVRNNNDEIKGDLIEVIKYIANKIEWNEEKNIKEGKENIASIDKSIDKIKLQENQIEIISIVAPKILGYIENLEVTINDLNKVIDENVFKIEKLNVEKKILETKVKELEEIKKENEKIKEEQKLNIEKLTKEVDKLNDYIDKLKDNNEELNERILDLKEYKKDLARTIRSLRNEKESLIKENEKLKIENKELKKEIKNLKDRLSEDNDDDDTELSTDDDDDDTVVDDVYGSN